MHAQRTALARFIDMSALWSLCLMAWFYFLATRLRSLYPALLLACACAAASIALVALTRRALTMRRHGAALTREQARTLCEHMALADPQAALYDIAAWLAARGLYSDCRVEEGVIVARSRAGVLTAIALISAWPGERADAASVLAALRRCAGAASDARAVVSTAPYTPEALALAHRAGARLIAPEALAELMRAALPLCADAGRPRRVMPAALKSVLTHARTGRLGVYALVLSIAGRMLGLPYFRAAGLICALLWLICAAQPRPRRRDTWW